MKVLLAGAGGMVGQAVWDLCNSKGDSVFAYDHGRLEISDRDQVMRTIQGEQPDLVINCAAWTDVDGCEFDQEKAFAANAHGPENLALASRAANAGFITLSTDYVFDGTKSGFYTQRDDANPESVYAKSKLEGERRVRLAYARAIIVRSGFIFGCGGRNFLSTIIQRARRGEALGAIGDAYGTPTYAPDLASRLRELAQLDLPGIFHVVNSGEGASFAEFTRAALNEAGCHDTSVETVKMGSLNRPAPRPQNSRLKCLLSPAVGLEPLPFWKDAVRDFVAHESRTEVAAK